MKKSIKKSIAVILITGLISSAIPVAAEEKGQLDNVVFSYVNTDTKKLTGKCAIPTFECAWFKVSTLPKGTYMMYTCTEKKLPNGEKL